MARYEFKSVFAAEIQIYIDEKYSAGFKSDNFRRNLIGFDRFCVEQSISSPIFEICHATKWLKQKESESNTTHYSRINASKQFLKYLAIKGYNVYVVRDVKHKYTDFRPHIYTNDEVNRYFLAVDSYTSGRNRKNAIQYPVIFRILYCCGTRINETLGIRKQDVDLEKGIILLNEAKNNKQRYVVMGDDLNKLVNDYANKCFYLLNDTDYIFTNANGGRFDKKTLYGKHRDFLQQARIPYLGGGNGPRLHDWRHHMAVYSFKQLVDSGLDMYVAIPILSTYLGHKTILATEKYVRLSLEIFPYIEEKFHPMVNRIFGNIAKGGDDHNENH